MRRLLGAVAVVVALALGAAPAGAEEATVEEIDVATLLASFPIPADDGGTCSGVPDAIPGIFDFTDACARHDACYAAGVETRPACDLAFRQDMIAACVAQHPDALDARRYACLTFAELYFLGVRFFGQFA